MMLTRPLRRTALNAVSTAVMLPRCRCTTLANFFSMPRSRLHADSLDHDVRAATVGERADRLDRVALECVDDLDVGGALRGGQTVGQHVDADDLARAEDARELERHQADRAAADHGDRLARLQVGPAQAGVGRGNDVRQEQHLLVAETVRHLARAVVRERHARVLGLATRVAAVQIGVAEQVRRPFA